MHQLAFGWLILAVGLSACGALEEQKKPERLSLPISAGRSRPWAVYVGSGFYSQPSSIHTLLMNPETGALTEAGRPLQTPVAPTYLAFHPTARRLYATIENKPGQIMALSIDPGSGALSPINQAPAGGDASTHIALDREGRFAFESHYGSGNLTVVRLEAAGRVGTIVDDEEHGPAANAHGVLVLPSNRFVLLALKGANRVAQYRFDPETGQLTPNNPPAVESAPGAGPRHLALHPTGPWVYAINELGVSVTQYRLDPAAGTLVRAQDVSLLPPDVKAGSTGAEIQIAPSGRFAYASVRGHDSIAVLAIDPTSGALTRIANQHTRGKTPRMFTLDPTGRYLIAANQGSDTLTVFAVDPVTGLLEPRGSPVPVPKPSWVGVIALWSHGGISKATWSSQ